MRTLTLVVLSSCFPACWPPAAIVAAPVVAAQPAAQADTGKLSAEVLKIVNGNQATLDAVSGGDDFEGGETNVEIFLRSGRNTCMIPPRGPLLPLVGRKMPGLDLLNVSLSAEDLRGKRVLLCFFELSHGGSRNYMRELAARSHELAEQNIVLVGVQIWDRNRTQLDRWLATNGVSFPVGMLADEWEQAPKERATYHSALQNRVPWLVLAGSNHIVRAEGFDITRLNGMINGIDGTTASEVKSRQRSAPH